MKIQHDVLMEEGNETWDPLRIAFAVSFLMANGLEIYNIMRGNPFDMVAYCTGMGIMISTTGAGLWASSFQKDPPKEKTNDPVGDISEVR